MPLNFALHKNHLTAGPTDYKAVVQNPNSKTLDDIIDLMVSRGSTITRAEALATLEEYRLAVEQLVKDGNNIRTPLVNVSLSIKGVFTGEDANFDPSRHSVRINVIPGTSLREITGDVQVSRIKGRSPQPAPLYLDDLVSGSRNDKLSPNNIARLKGCHLKFDPSDPDQGIFLIAGNGAETRISLVSYNKPSRLDFLVPGLAKGIYRLEVRAIIKNTKIIRKGSLSGEVTVL